MFNVSPLRILTDFDEERFKRDGIRDHPPIRGPNGEYFGHEWARWRYDALDGAVDVWLAARGQPSAILDIGCATGVRAAQFAQAGHRVTGVDIVDPTVFAMSSSLTFIHADIRTLAPSRFDIAFDLIHARRVINFLTLDELDRLFDFCKAALSTSGILALNLFTLDVQPDRMQHCEPPGSRPPIPLGPGMATHHFTEVHHLLQARGLLIVEAFSDDRAEVGLIARRAEA